MDKKKCRSTRTGTNKSHWNKTAILLLIVSLPFELLVWHDAWIILTNGVLSVFDSDFKIKTCERFNILQCHPLALHEYLNVQPKLNWYHNKLF